MTSMISSVEGQRSGLRRKPFIKESSRMTRSVIFLRVPIWRGYTLGKACMLLGGRVVYAGKDIHAAHARARDGVPLAERPR